MTIGKPLKMQAVLQSGALDPDDLAVELVYGRQRGDEFTDAVAVPMRRLRSAGKEHHFEVDFDAAESGVFAYGLRVRPAHRYQPNPFATYLVKWA